MTTLCQSHSRSVKSEGNAVMVKEENNCPGTHYTKNWMEVRLGKVSSVKDSNQDSLEALLNIL